MGRGLFERQQVDAWTLADLGVLNEATRWHGRSLLAGTSIKSQPRRVRSARRTVQPGHRSALSVELQPLSDVRRVFEFADLPGLEGQIRRREGFGDGRDWDACGARLVDETLHVGVAFWELNTNTLI